MTLILTILLIFAYLVILSRPDVVAMFGGYYFATIATYQQRDSWRRFTIADVVLLVRPLCRIIYTSILSIAQIT